MAKSRGNQGKCCDAVVRVLERHEDAHRRKVTPEPPTGDGVELTCRIGEKTFALEHTLIEPYSGRITDDQHFLAVLEPVIQQLKDYRSLPRDASYKLVVDPNTFRKIRRHQHPAIREALRRWILAKAPELPKPLPGRVTYIRERPHDVGFMVTLQRTAASNGSIGIARFSLDNPEEKLRERVRKALIDKCPKLFASKRGGGISVLILEDEDVALLNPQLIGEAVRHELRHTDVPPDQIYLVDTKLPEWTIYCLKRGAICWPSEITCSPEFHEIDSGQLIDLVPRQR